ncbi:MAG: hypothetical protein ACOVK2_04875 [Candidatus Fonsibacter sp.]
MKKIILTVAAVLTLGLTFAQECDVKTVVDEYTGDRTIQTSFTKLLVGSYQIYKNSGYTMLLLKINCYKPQIVDKGQTVYIKFDDGYVLQGSNTSLSMSEYDGIYYNYVQIILTEEQLVNFESKLINGIRCGISETVVYAFQAKKNKKQF